MNPKTYQTEICQPVEVSATIHQTGDGDGINTRYWQEVEILSVIDRETGVDMLSILPDSIIDDLKTEVAKEEAIQFVNRLIDRRKDQQ